MPRLRLPLHGRDHRPGGADPIPGLSSGSGRVLAGQVYNDANIIAGTGFTAGLLGNEITVTFDVPFDAPPTVVLTPNNNNPADVSGEYGMSQISVTTDDFVATGTEFDGTPNIGGFNFAAIETDQYVP